MSWAGNSSEAIFHQEVGNPDFYEGLGDNFISVFLIENHDTLPRVQLLADQRFIVGEVMLDATHQSGFIAATLELGSHGHLTDFSDPFCDDECTGMGEMQLGFFSSMN